jgi:hypothetical protein
MRYYVSLDESTLNFSKTQKTSRRFEKATAHELQKVKTKKVAFLTI